MESKRLLRDAAIEAFRVREAKRAREVFEGLVKQRFAEVLGPEFLDELVLVGGDATLMTVGIQDLQFEVAIRNNGGSRPAATLRLVLKEGQLSDELSSLEDLGECLQNART